MLARVNLILVALGQAVVGVWGELAPHGFYDQFPWVFGQHWVVTMGPYNEHLVRDYAAAELGLTVLLALAAHWYERRLVIAAGVAFLVATVPHFLYHLTTTSMLSTTGNVLSLGSFVLEIVTVAAVVLAHVQRSQR